MDIGALPWQAATGTLERWAPDMKTDEIPISILLAIGILLAPAVAFAQSAMPQSKTMTG